MSIICPCVTAFDLHTYRSQLETVSVFAERVHIDLMDGEFTPTKSPNLDQLWLPATGVVTDIHVMYQRPQDILEQLVVLKPSLVIVQAESDCDIPKFAAELRRYDIKTGVSLLQKTSVESVGYVLPHVQHALVFSGDLGKFGGLADMQFLSKVAELKALNLHIEIGWDGGINIDNARQLSESGVDVLNVGGAIQRAENPHQAYETLRSKIT